MKNQKGFSAVEGLLVLILVAVVGFAGWYVGTKNDSESQKSSKTENTSSNNDKEAATKESEEALVIKAVKAKYPDAPNLQVTAREYKDEFAKGSAGSEETGGFAFIAKKVNGVWSVIYVGQQLPSKADGQKYGMPEGWYSSEY